jgi:hypothetical protein
MVAGQSAKSATLSLTFEARDVTHAYEVRHLLERNGFMVQGGSGSVIRRLDS